MALCNSSGDCLSNAGRLHQARGDSLWKGAEWPIGEMNGSRGRRRRDLVGKNSNDVLREDRSGQ